MNEAAKDRLYNLLPATYRICDVQQGEPLRALLRVIEEEMLALERDIDGLYDDWFIETCSEWVVPYIGDLLDVKNVRPISSSAWSLRSYVANALAYRRRKGTAEVLEQMSRDVTGWPAHVVEFFEQVATTQHLNHLRPDNLQTPDLRETDRLELLGGPFGKIAHTADVSPIAVWRGKYSIPNLGIFLWRLQSYPLKGVSACKVEGGYTFDPTGRDVPLFNSPQTRAWIGYLSEEIDVPGPLRRRPLQEELERRRQELRRWGRIYARKISYFDQNPVFSIDLVLKEGESCQVKPEEVLICDLSDWRVPPKKTGLYVFSWNKIPEIKKFLTTKLSIDWVKDAEITKKDDKTIRVSANNNSLLLKLNDEKTEAILEIDGVKKYEFVTKTENGELNIYTELKAAVDPEIGRLALFDGASSTAEEVLVSYCYGFSGDVGAGPYDRFASVRESLCHDVDWQVGVTHDRELIDNEEIFGTVGDALKKWDKTVQGWGKDAAGKVCLIAIMDSRTYSEDLILEIPESVQLSIIAAGWPAGENGNSPRQRGLFTARAHRPHLLGCIKVRGTADAGSPDPGELMIDGLLMEGKVIVQEGNLGVLRVAHSTQVSSRFSGESGIEVLSDGPRNNDSLELIIEGTICGKVELAKSVSRLVVAESILDGDGGTALLADGTVVRIEKSTILGRTQTRILEASNSIFIGRVEVEQEQEGCIRFCYLPQGPNTPRRFRCQPDLVLKGRFGSEKEAVLCRTRPVFTSLRYGDPGYAQLSLACAEEIRTGAEDGSEMGAFNSLQQPQREANLGAALEEYLPFGLEAGIFYMT